MKTASIYKDVTYNADKPMITVMFETTFTKEIRIAMQQGTLMKKHKTPFPIVIQIIEGEINFGVQEETLNLKKGELIALDGGIPHDLSAVSDSIIRLTLTKSDEINRVKTVINK